MSVCGASALTVPHSHLPTLGFRSDPLTLLHLGNAFGGLVSGRDSGVVDNHKLFRQTWSVRASSGMLSPGHRGFPASGKRGTRMAGKHPAPGLSQLALPHSRQDTAPELAPSGLFPSCSTASVLSPKTSFQCTGQKLAPPKIRLILVCKLPCSVLPTIPSVPEATSSAYRWQI